MNKHTVAISAPVDTYSGYGARSRDLVRAILAMDKYDVSIISQRWGNTRTGFLEDHNEIDISSRVVNQLSEKPDIWIQITVPNEFNPIGNVNIGITAGIETTLAHASWIEGCNRMSAVFVSSKHAKVVLERSKFNAIDSATNRPLRQVQLEVPVEVLFEGADLSKYFKKTITEADDTFDLSMVQESFCYLFVGHWMQGDLGHDRKNVGYLIKAFLETFKNKPNSPALILKTQSRGSSIIDREQILNQIDLIKQTVNGSHPNIYIVHGDLSDRDMNNLYNNPKVKAMVTFTKGEGFCRPLLEFSLIQKPILCSGWSGQLDFLDKDYNILVGGTLEKVHPSAAIQDTLLLEADWFRPDDGHVAKGFKDLFKNYKKYLVDAKKQSYKNKSEFSLEAMTVKLEELLNKYTADLPMKVDLNLPKLTLPKLTKL